MSEKILEVDQLSKSFGSVQAVDKISLSIEKGDIVGIIGPNGAGKTTFINVITGSLLPTGGTVHFKNEDITETPENDRAQKGLVRSFQIPSLYGDLTALENVRGSVISRENKSANFYKPLSRDQSTKEEAISCLEEFGLKDEMNTEVNSLPHGDRKILDIAASFAMDPSLILLDEPTSGVGSEQTEAVMQQTLDVAKKNGISLIFVEHDMELVSQFADRVIAFHQGRILEQGSPEDVLQSETVKEHIREEGA